MTSPLFRNDLDQLSRHYSQRLRAHGDSPQAVQFSDRKTQERRMEVLIQVGDLQHAKILDFGCGTAHLLTLLRERIGFDGDYVGYDLSAEMIQTASRKYPTVRFEQRNVLADGVPEEFDYIVISGIFNNRVSDNWGLMTTLLKALFPYCRNALAFNALSTYVDFCEPDLFYVSPEKVFGFCKRELSPCVALRHDYLVKPGVIPFEFAVYVYRVALESKHV